MTHVTEIIIEAKLHLNRGWWLTRIDLDAEGVVVNRSEACHGFFSSSATAREWFDRQMRPQIGSKLSYLADNGITVRFECVSL